ncbi:MAG: 4-aminobutyrate--2-oxoglutarate transaminase [Deinococcales bacterium]
MLGHVRDVNVPRGLATAHPIFPARAKGARMWDVDGTEYIDFTGGIGVMNIGHANERVVDAVQAQLERFSHTSAQVAMYEPYVRLAERLNALAPGDHAKKTLLLTTGVEAVENAVKIARAATGRPGILAFSGGFHGRTLLGLSLTGKVRPYKQNFGPFAPDVYHAPFPYALRGWSAADALRALDDVLVSQVAPERVAAVLIEPVLGEGGFVPAPFEFLRALRALTERHGILLIADEIQSGFGRTGTMFAIEHSGVVPDLITVAKSLAGGLPLSGVVGRADVMDAPEPGGLGGTYGGNPLACAAALAVLDVFEESRLLERAQRLGEDLFARFDALRADHPVIREVRGLGAMVAIELIADGEQGIRRGAELTQRVIAEARQRGLLLLKAGQDGNVVRVLVPLTVEPDELDRAFAVLGQAFDAARAAGVAG